MSSKSRKISIRNVEWKAQGDGKYAREELDTLVNVYGPPSCIDKRAGGAAFWVAKNLTGTPFWRLEIVDQVFLHGQPENHPEFLTAGIPFVQRDQVVQMVTAFSKSLWYDRLGEILYARGDSMKWIWALLALAVNVTQRNIDPVRMGTAKGRKTILREFVRSTQDPEQGDQTTTRYRHMVEAYVVKVTRKWQRAKRIHRA